MSGHASPLDWCSLGDHSLSRLFHDFPLTIHSIYMNEGVHRNHFRINLVLMSGKGGDQAFPIHLRVMTGAFAFLVGRMVTHT